jgi:5-formyltetrahydrofolate cyclo-ligase
MKINRDIVLEKKHIRLEIKNLLDGLSSEDHKNKSIIINDSLIKSKEYIAAQIIFMYHPFRKEIDTREIIKDALIKNKKVILPKISGGKLDTFFIKDLQKDLKLGSFNIMEPDPLTCKKASLSCIDLIIVPGLGFDLNFNRLGYGGGFYDRILGKIGKKAKKIALAFDLQIFDNIPTCLHDLKVDIIITESHIYRDLKIDN